MILLPRSSEVWVEANPVVLHAVPHRQRQRAVVVLGPQRGGGLPIEYRMWSMIARRRASEDNPGAGAFGGGGGHDEIGHGQKSVRGWCTSRGAMSVGRVNGYETLPRCPVYPNSSTSCPSTASTRRPCSRYLGAHGIDGPLQIRQFQGGQSNPTFHLLSADRRIRVAQEAAGHLCCRAHTMSAGSTG